MITTVRGYKINSNIAANQRVRRQMADYIEGQQRNRPPGFVCHGGRVRLCTLSDGSHIDLFTAFTRQTEVAVVIEPRKEQILARIFARWAHRNHRKETFIVIDGVCIYYGGRKISSSASKRGRVNKSRIQKNRQRLNEEKQINLWLRNLRLEPPDAAKRPIGAKGIIHLCDLGNKPVNINVDPILDGHTADVFFFNKPDGRKIAVVEVADFEIDEEFTLPSRPVNY